MGTTSPGVQARVCYNPASSAACLSRGSTASAPSVGMKKMRTCSGRWAGSAYDNAMMESFFGTLQRELLDRRQWATRRELAFAIFEWIEAWFNPRRRHTSIDYRSPVDYERLYTAAVDAA